VLAVGISTGHSAGQVFPGATWAFRTPAEARLDGAKLNQIANMLDGRGCIVRDGYMVATWGTQNAKDDWASASKPVISTLLFFAIEEGLVGSVDERILDSGWSLITPDRPMTFRHLANMTGGYTRAETPGAAWAYNDYAIELYAHTLFDRVYGQSSNTVALAPARLGALQFQDGSIFASNHRLDTSVRDFARIGWFWANKGFWNGAQLLPQHYFDAYRKPHVPIDLPRTRSSSSSGDYLKIGTYGGGSDQTEHGPGIYGFNWWFNDYGPDNPTARTWPDAPSDTFQANGHWGAETLTVIPSLGIVLAHFRGANSGLEPGSTSVLGNQVLKLLVEAVGPESPDFDADSDVDLDDFGFLQSCTTADQEEIRAGCRPADLNHDTRIDAGDVTLFLGCMSGPNVEPVEECQ
jgi:CubicO group peptidase (beta-lactamase class C family)